MSNEGLTVKFDLTGFRAKMKVMQQIQQAGLQGLYQGQFVRAVRNTQVYLAREMTRALDQNGGIPEGSSQTVRGQTWKGWARWQTRKYGTSIDEGTRYYQRKFRRGLSFNGPHNQAHYAKVKKIYTGTLRGKDRKAWSGHMGDLARNASFPEALAFGRTESVRARAFEKVWRERASGAFYSSSSKLMQDTGRLKAALIVMDTRLNGKVIELRPGPGMPDYFWFQNRLRRIWVLQKGVDMPIIVKFFADDMKQIAKKIQEAK